MKTITKPDGLRRNRLSAALAACGIVASVCVTPLDVLAASGGPGIPIGQTPAPTASPNALTFSTPLGTTSLSQRVVVTNLAGVPSFVLPNFFAPGFFYTTDCPATPTLPDGASCNFDVTFRPVSFTTSSGNLTANLASGSINVPVTGTATRSPQPLVQTSPTSLDFPPVEVGDYSAVQFLTIRSVSQVGMDIGATGIGDFIVLPAFNPMSLTSAGDPAPKPLAKNAPRPKDPLPPYAGNCFGFLSPLQACDLGVAFGPTAAGSRSGRVLISSDISQGTLSVPSRGVGRAAGGLSPLTVTDRIDFGTQAVGTASTPKPFGIVNNTSAPAVITELSVTGDFEIQKGPCDTIDAGATCTANVIFKPTVLGPRTGTATVRSPVDPDPYVSPLSGSGSINPSPFLSVSATQLGYGTGIIGGGESLSLSITSTGQVPVSISSIYALGDFIPTHACPASLAPGVSCTIEVGFSPRLLGLRNGSLVIESNAVGSPHSVQLQGNGCTFFSASARGRTLLCSPN